MGGAAAVVDLVDGARAFGDSTEGVALTCASCHVRTTASGQRVVGAGTERDFGAAMIAGDGAIPVGRAAAIAQWGAGRVDVSTEDADDPLRIPDLRAVRWQRYWQYGGAVENTGLAALAVRIETLIIGAYGGAVRPPRVIALAVYVDSLADELPTRVAVTEDERRGQTLFSERCGGCHVGEGMSGGLVSPAAFGTDPRHAANTERGTGFYRVPSLRGVSTRGALLHDGSGTLPSLLAREPEGDRKALMAYLRTL